MDATFINNALDIMGESPNTWTTLFEKCQRIGLLADNNISIDPRYKAFYFNTASEMLYITYYDGILIKYTDGDEVPEGYVVMQIHNNKYLNKISINAVNCEIGGETYKIHAAISYDKIVGFYYPNVDPQAILNNGLY